MDIDEEHQPAVRRLEEAKMNWKQGWRPNKFAPNNFGPEKWAMYRHPSGYTIGEVDAGKYMACDPDGNGIKDERGCYLEWSSPESAQRDLEQLF